MYFKGKKQNFDYSCLIRFIMSFFFGNIKQKIVSLYHQMHSHFRSEAVSKDHINAEDLITPTFNAAKILMRRFKVEVGIV